MAGYLFKGVFCVEDGDTRVVSVQRVRHSYQGTMISLKLTFSHLKNLHQLVTEERLILNCFVRNRSQKWLFCQVGSCENLKLEMEVRVLGFADISGSAFIWPGPIHGPFRQITIFDSFLVLDCPLINLVGF